MSAACLTALLLPATLYAPLLARPAARTSHAAARAALPQRAGAPALSVASGASQSALAFAASSAPGYETVFPTPLVVRVTDAAMKSLRFFCATPGCRFALSEQPDAVKRIDPRTYEVPVEDGRATLSLTLGTDAPGTFTVIARPMQGMRRNGGAEARFRLTAR